VKLAEFEVTHRDLYTAPERAPVKDGVLDRRLVSELCSSTVPFPHIAFLLPGHDGEERILRDLRTFVRGLRRPLRVHQALRSRLPHRLLQTHYCRPAMHLQG
jgi:hypothetical protein